MTEDTQFVVEIRSVHAPLHKPDQGAGLPEWSDALDCVLPGEGIQTLHFDVASARSVARRLHEDGGIPSTDIRITRVSRTSVDIEGANDDGMLSKTSDAGIYRWYSEALRRYGIGHAFAVGATLTEARSAAMDSFLEYLASDSWWGTGPEPDGSFLYDDDREAYEEAVKMFQADIDADPIMVSDAFIVLGSE